MDPISMFLIYMAIYIGLAYLTDKLNEANIEDPIPDELQFPELVDGKEYPVVFGTCWVRDGRPVWWGDINRTAIRKKVGKKIDWKFGLPGHESLQNDVYATVGYHNYAGMLLKLCHGPVDGVKQIRFNDVTAWPTANDNDAYQADGATSAVINEEQLFGGQFNGGGIVGTIDICYGATTQSSNSYLVSQLGSNISYNRGLVSLVFRQINWGTSSYLKVPKVLLKRTDILSDGSAQWYPAKADISGSMNGVHVIRECMSNQQWGLHYSTGLFDSTSWEAAADTCYTEGLGISRLFDSTYKRVEDFIEEVKRHIDCVVYQDMETGLIKIKLVRDDYSIGALDTYDETDILDVTDFLRPTYGMIPDEVVVNYWDIVKDDGVSISDKDIATLTIQNGKHQVKKIDYYGFIDGDVAAEVAARDRQQITSMLATFRIKAKRTMAHIQPGDVFVLDWPLLGISNFVVRVMVTKYGTLSEGYIILECMQDVFSTESAVYSKPAASGWTDPRNSPVDVTNYLLQEAPYWDIIGQIGVSGAADLANGTGFLEVAAGVTSGDAYDYELLVRDTPASAFNSDGRDSFTPTGLLDTFMPLNAQDVTVTLTDVEGLAAVAVGDYCVLEDEICKVLSVTLASNQVQLARGCLDTVPAYHSGDDSGGPGARVWFIGSVGHYVGTTYAATATPGVKILPRTALGQLAEGSATAHNSDSFNSRMIRPYPPGNFKVNGQSYPSTFSGQPTISWNHRDRTQQTSEITEHSDAGVGPEAGTTYTLTIYDETGVGLLRTVSGLTGTSYTYDWNDEIADSGLSSGDPLNSSLRFVLKSVRDGYDSWQSYDVTVNRA